VKKKKRYVIICPKCGSTNVTKFTGMYSKGGDITSGWICKDCNYGRPYGSLFPEIEESEIEKFRREIKKKSTRIR